MVDRLGGLYPPPWNANEHPEKTEGWLEFQRCLFRGDYSKDMILIDAHLGKNSPIKHGSES